MYLRKNKYPKKFIFYVINALNYFIFLNLCQKLYNQILKYKYSFQ